MRWPIAAVTFLFLVSTAAAQRGSRRFNPSNANDLPEEDVPTSTGRTHRFQSQDRTRSSDAVPRQDFPHRDTEVVPPTRSAPRAPLRSRNEVSSRDPHPRKEVPIVSSGAVEYERLQLPIETTRRSFTPRTQSSSSSNLPEEPRPSRTRSDAETTRKESRRSGTRFPKRGNTEGSTVAPPDEGTTRRSFSRVRGNPTSSSQTPRSSDVNSGRGNNLRNTVEPAAATSEPRSRTPDTARPTRIYADVRGRTGGRNTQSERGDGNTELDQSSSRTGARSSGDVSGRQQFRSKVSPVRQDGRREETHTRERSSDRFRSRGRSEDKTEPVTPPVTLPPQPSTEPNFAEDVTLGPVPTSAAPNPLARGASRSSGRGRGSARASSADLKSSGLKEKETDEVSDNDNYPEVYKQLVKSGTDPKDILVPKYKQLISKYAKKQPTQGNRLDSRPSPQTPRVTVRPQFEDFRPKFIPENPVESFHIPKTTLPIEEASKLPKKTKVDLNQYNETPLNTPRNNKQSSQYETRKHPRPIIDEFTNQYNPTTSKPNSRVNDYTSQYNTEPRKKPKQSTDEYTNTKKPKLSTDEYSNQYSSEARKKPKQSTDEYNEQYNPETRKKPKLRTDDYANQYNPEARKKTQPTTDEYTNLDVSIQTPKTPKSSTNKYTNQFNTVTQLM